ncbi:hypothetical protein ACF1A5_05790 [Streptomyces sp. NPDC014864]|uniref:hypothetical protein n=1 Tax=Streptomyces sp. NPDC014864 TaxID=3364924 RepID=UPI0036FB65F5
MSISHTSGAMDRGGTAGAALTHTHEMGMTSSDTVPADPASSKALEAVHVTLGVIGCSGVLLVC